MQHPDEIARFLAQKPDIVRLLAVVEALGIEDCWIGAGLIRNAVWDHLHGFPPGPVAGSDVDVVYCDPCDASPSRDLSVERELLARHPHVPWSVHNQARMHLANGDPPYQDVADAIRCWPETATAVAARIRGGRVEILAPHGLEDLIAMIVRPTPVFSRKMPAYRARVAQKNWARRWPHLKFVDA